MFEEHQGGQCGRSTASKWAKVEDWGEWGQGMQGLGAAVRTA